jgi:hypothetical protein
MKRGKSRPFTAPRASKPVETGHRKDNVEWGKRMERQLEQIEKRQKSVETNHNTSDEEDLPIASFLGTVRNGKRIKLMSEREADEMAKFGEVIRYSSDSEGGAEPITQTRLSEKKRKEKDGETKGNTEFIGVKVARDFGKQGIVFGEIVALEFDSGDEAKEDPFYVVKYSDGDQEDLDRKELSYTLELYHKTIKNNGDKVVTVPSGSDDEEEHDADDTMSSASDDEDNYVPSPEVQIFITPFALIYSYLTLPLWHGQKKRPRKGRNQKSQSSSSSKEHLGTGKVCSYWSLDSCS